MDKELKQIAQIRTERIKTVIKAIETKFPYVGHQKDVAEGLFFDESTLSEYLNPKNYTDRKFESILKRLVKIYFVSETFLREGTGEMFDFDPARILAAIHHSIDMLKMGYAQRGIAYEQVPEEQNKEIAQLKDTESPADTNKKKAKIASINSYPQNEVADEAAEEKLTSYNKEKSDPDNLNIKDGSSKYKSKAPKKDKGDK